MQSNPLAQATGLFQQGQYQDVVSLLSSVRFKEVKDQAQAHFLLGSCLHIGGSIQGALKHFRSCIELDPEHTEAGISLSVVLNDIGKYSEAESVFKKLDDTVKLTETGVKENRVNEELALEHLRIAKTYSRYHRYQEALAEIQRGVQLAPDSLSLRVFECRVLAKLDRRDESVQKLKDLVKLNPDQLELRVVLGLQLYKIGQIVDAQDNWEYVIRKNPTHAKARRYLELTANNQETQLR